MSSNHGPIHVTHGAMVSRTDFCITLQVLQVLLLVVVYLQIGGNILVVPLFIVIVNVYLGIFFEMTFKFSPVSLK